MSRRSPGIMKCNGSDCELLSTQKRESDLVKATLGLPLVGKVKPSRRKEAAYLWEYVGTLFNFSGFKSTCFTLFGLIEM